MDGPTAVVGTGMYIGGEHKVARLNQLRVWAERGLIHWEDGKDNSYASISIKDALLRIQALNEMLGNRVDDKDIPRFRELREKIQVFIEKMQDVIAQAREQGAPDDPTRRSYKPAQVVIPEMYFEGLKC
jgi:hypothetical protein